MKNSLSRNIGLATKKKGSQSERGTSVLFPTVKHNWMTMTESVQNYIGSLNWGYRVALREKKVTYENAYGEFVGPHTVKVLHSHGCWVL